jgi:hypothetical protein
MKTMKKRDEEEDINKQQTTKQTERNKEQKSIVRCQSLFH